MSTSSCADEFLKLFAVVAVVVEEGDGWFKPMAREARNADVTVCLQSPLGPAASSPRTAFENTNKGNIKKLEKNWCKTDCRHFISE